MDTLYTAPMPIDKDRLILIGIYKLEINGRQLYGARAFDGRTARCIDSRVPIFTALESARGFILNTYPDSHRMTPAEGDDPSLVEVWV